MNTGLHEWMVRRRSIAGRIAAALACGYGLLLVGAAAWSRVDVTHVPCPTGSTSVLVDTEARVLCLCRDGRVEGTFRVALGRGGKDKRREGDGRTPTGWYDLGEPRASRRYHLFIPVAFPTLEQRRAGLSGSDVGVHGPHIAFAWLRHATVWVDWTRGCVAVGTRSEAEEIAAWVRANGKNTPIWLK